MISLLEKNKSQLLTILIDENPDLKAIFDQSDKLEKVNQMIRAWIENYLDAHQEAKLFYTHQKTGREQFNVLSWQDYAAIRIIDYLDHAGRNYPDPNLKNTKVKTDPFSLCWMLYNHEDIVISNDLLIDMILLFRQFMGKISRTIPEKELVQSWMDRHPSGLDVNVVKMRNRNKDRIIRKYIHLMDRGKKKDPRFKFPEGLSFKEKYKIMAEWWNDRLFQLRFAVRSPELLNDMLNHTLNKRTMKLLYNAKKAGIPTFVNPYYLSLLNVDEPGSLKGSDQAIRDYVIYSRELVEEFGEIAAWEKEDIVE
ncbi:MAG: hypothetical protein U9R60_17060, partial [Bacteroidota bacterium]|nr:hypothetical protein [Bacteroidota bacterium]